MFKFLRDAQAELEHVVWPTPNETKKYMMYNIVVIVVVTVLLMALGFLIQSGLVAVRGLFPHDIVSPVSDTVTQGELDDITEALEQKLSQSGATNTGSTNTGITIDLTGAIAE
ncbi:MAG: preprotein translocase subunit SecE [Patescibacteria group bacterium]